MKKIISSTVFLFILFSSHAIQQQTPYQLPDKYSFDYEVIQEKNGDKDKSKTEEIHYYYTKSGEYAAVAISEGPGKSHLAVFTKDGTNILFDDDKKAITIIRIKNMLPDFASIARDSKKSNPPSQNAGNNEKKAVVTKTGKTKSISGYTADQYMINDNKEHKGYVWYVKTDFDTQLTFAFGMGSPTMPKMQSSHASEIPFLNLLTDKNAMLAEIDKDDETQVVLSTKSISKTSYTAPTKGYQVNNYSNMNLKEMIEDQTKKKSNQ